MIVSFRYLVVPTTSANSLPPPLLLGMALLYVEKKSTFIYFSYVELYIFVGATPTALLYLRIVRGRVSAGGNKLCYGRKCALMKSPGQASPRSTSSQTPPPHPSLLSLPLSLSLELETFSRATPDAMRCSHSPPVAMGDILAQYWSRS